MLRAQRQAVTGMSLGLLLIMLACNLPTQTPRAVCTPPACGGNGSLMCPEGEECPGGCGFICATPTRIQESPSPQAVCTPPLCEGDGILMCPEDEECPGGCGFICATPTPTQESPSDGEQTTSPGSTEVITDTCSEGSDGICVAPTLPPPSNSPTPTPTTESPACEPPVCPSSQIPYCPGECPDNCGLICVTPTPAPPEVVEFSVDRTTVVEGQSVQITWQCLNADQISILWPGAGGTMDGLSEIDPAGGTATITPYGSPVLLEATNDVGQAEAELSLDIECAHAWVPELVNAREGRCPKPAQTTWAAQQPFENGRMIWTEFDQMIYVFYDQSDPKTYATYPDTFEEGKDPEQDPKITPPTGLYQPIRGFGKVWRENPEVRSGLGWATAPESGFETWQQRYQGFGLHNITIWMESLSGTIYELNPTGQVWEVYVP